MRRKRSSLSRRAFSARLRSVMSVVSPKIPTTSPSSLITGAFTTSRTRLRRNCPKGNPHILLLPRFRLPSGHDSQLIGAKLICGLLGVNVVIGFSYYFFRAHAQVSRERGIDRH